MAPSVNRNVVAVGSSSRPTSSPLKYKRRSGTVNQERRKTQRLNGKPKENPDHVVVDDELAEDLEGNPSLVKESLENGDLVFAEPRSVGCRKYPPQLDDLLGKVVYSEGDADRTKVRKALSLFKEISMILKTSNPTSGRVDREVGTIMKANDKCLNNGKLILGDVPGVEVGDEFECRVELAIVGLHRHYQGGIDYYNINDKIIATCIVASGKYADKMDKDNSGILEYSGQGGMPDKKKKVDAKDKKMERGNLALKNSMDEGTPVRIIRGVKERKANDSLDSKGKLVSTYTYDGLYTVENYSVRIGCYDTKDFLFQLRRISGEQNLSLKEETKSMKSKVRNLQPQPLKKSSVRNLLSLQDVSQGEEKMPISVVNKVDSEKMPTQFKYITTMRYSSWCNLQQPSEGCGCIDGCTDSKECSCSIKNEEIPYNEKGDILRAKPFIYECGPSCKCPPTCQNRVSQNGIKFKLELFKTESRGWGVRSLNLIRSGSFICEYAGELLKDSDAEQRNDDQYLFDICDDDSATCENKANSSSCCDSVEEDGFTIDAAQYGNIGRFINHSCSPNLYPQNVLYDHDDKRMPHIMLFAQESISPFTELTYDYNYKEVCDSNGNIKKKDCHCGSSECKGRLYCGNLIVDS